jgi:excisionase family DNA binding protein
MLPPMPRPADLPRLSRSAQRLASRASRDRNDGRSLLGIPEAAKFLKVSERTVYRLIHKGELRSIQIGPSGQLRIRPSDLDDFLDRNVVS